MKSLKYIFFLVLMAIIGGSIYVATLDGSFDVQQSRTMKVPASVAYNNINDFKNWQHWGPWYELDSTIVATFPEKTSGIGASYSWTGKEGDGSMRTISTIENKEIIQQINFGSDSTPEVYWKLDTKQDSTIVTWGMRGKNSFSEKIFWLLNGGIEKNMTPMYKRGLELLEIQLIKQLDVHSITYKNEVDFGGGYYLYQTIACRIEDASKNMKKMFPEIIEYMATNSIEASGKPFTLNHQTDFINNSIMFSACIPVKERIVTEGTILTGFLEPQKTFKSIFKGNYKFLPEIWPEIYKNLEEKGFKAVQKGFSFEIYTVSPQETENPAEWLTEIYVPIE
ncbi:GyrI-like domain-containing protein [Lutibacter holmesii]|uniref:GyrI-like domain-containing protein n=1 Tax=Lutibacter holmesii TaxID=1137985 RepID=A0ABW3WPD4_9FLAO